MNTLFREAHLVLDVVFEALAQSGDFAGAGVVLAAVHGKSACVASLEKEFKWKSE